MPTTPDPPAEPESRQNSTRLNHDEWIQVLTLRDAGFTYQQITAQLQLTYQQVQYTCQSHQATPKKAPGQIPKLSDDVDKIIDFISSSKRTQCMPYYKVIQELDLPVGTTALSQALKKRGYSWCEALQKPPLSDQNKHVHLCWALEHVNWTMEQWNQIMDSSVSDSFGNLLFFKSMMYSSSKSWFRDIKGQRSCFNYFELAFFKSINC